MTPVHQLGVSDVLILAASFWLVTKVVRRITSRSSQGTKLNGPPSESLLFGLNRKVVGAPDSGLLYQEWAARYGPVFEIPTAFRGRKVILCDPKAVNHFYSMERTIYIKGKLVRAVVANLFGRGILWAEGESHKRQRKALTPAFSNAAIRRLTEVFYDSAHKLKAHWEAIIDNAPPEGAIIDVEHWMNRVALDSIGIAGFSHDFQTLDGRYSAVAAAFDSLNFEGQGILSTLVFLLGTQFPFLANLPIKRNRIQKNLRRTMSGIADELLESTRREKSHVTDETVDRSIIGLLLKAEEEDAELRMDEAEVLAQRVECLITGWCALSRMHTFWCSTLTGYETTSISLTWALIELARQPEKQAKLREEITQFGATDPTWDQLGSALPYLDSVVLETLRLHPPVGETTRQAIVDDVVPVSEPITTASGKVVDSIVIAKDTIVTVSIRLMNQSEAFWGANAKEFQPERWLTLADDPLRAKEIQGHRHLITFLDGPRTCLGKSFALAEFKAVLSVLIRNFTFEFPDGPETEIVRHRALIPRPKVAGQPGGNVPMRVGRVE
ncbi:Cytochrome P450 [Mycena venus]|uniref:Cytochrome P450 n=1 Tax=Mycena venus TaxID=2733690 RepID=A0A8H6WTB7_9AGAR|nr:Cytochrome P450 [Mycena venus]